jgi:hypothetical protein
MMIVSSTGAPHSPVLAPVDVEDRDFAGWLKLPSLTVGADEAYGFLEERLFLLGSSNRLPPVRSLSPD